MNTDRRFKLLSHIIEDYIDTAQPVGSDYLVRTYDLNCSSATVRNDMVMLESEGYLESPHTSAGRVPTAKGYQEYLNGQSINNSEEAKQAIEASETGLLNEAHAQTENCSHRDHAKALAKAIAEISKNAVLVGFSEHDAYYTGLSFLFAQPEFKNINLLHNITEVVDQLDEKLPEVFASLSKDIVVKIGDENPFSNECSFIGFKYMIDNVSNMFGLLGPMRMPYIHNIERIGYIKQLLV